MKLRVLQVIQKPQLRGAEIFACQLSNNLIELGHDVKIVCLFPGSEQLPFNGRPIFLNRPQTKRFFDAKGWKILAQIVNEFKPDIVQANAGDTLKFCVLSRKLFNWKVPIVFRNASTISRYIKSFAVKWWNTYLFREVAFVISVSKASADDFVKLFPFMNNRIVNVGIGVECVRLLAPVKIENYVVHVGGFTFEKNHIGLLRIFQQLSKIYPSFKLVLVGDGPLKQSIENAVREMKLAHVQFMGWQKDVLNIIQGAKALLLPSIIEGLPGVVLEAMYCKTPVVAYDVGGIGEVVRKDQTGWLVDSGDEGKFVSAICDVLESSSTDDITDRAYSQVVEEFDNRLIASKFISVYSELLRS